jgi:hypothetical protein
MENQQTPSGANSPGTLFGIGFDAGMRAQIRQAAVWAKICAVCAFIGYAISLVVAVFGRQDVVSESANGVRIGMMLRAGSVGTVLISILIGGIINYFLYRFAVATIKGIDGQDIVRTNDGFNHLRIYFKICGVLLIIVFSLALLFVLVLIAGLSLAGK